LVTKSKAIEEVKMIELNEFAVRLAKEGKDFASVATLMPDGSP